jgi:transcriptional regulator with XRE-family HTH domain
MTFHTWIGGTLRDERKRLKLTMQQVADRAGVSQPAVVRLERGEGSKLDTLNRVADALGLTVAVVKLPPDPQAGEVG